MPRPANADDAPGAGELFFDPDTRVGFLLPERTAIEAAPVFTPEQKRAALVRELAFRRRCYPGWIAKLKMSRGEAAHEIAVMAAILKDYENV